MRRKAFSKTRDRLHPRWLLGDRIAAVPVRASCGSAWMKWGVRMADAQERDRFEAEEKLNELFEPDTLLPTQFFAPLARKKFPNGEHRLLVALMRDAVECFQKHIDARDSKRRQLYNDAENWIGDEDDFALFSFNNVCATLGMNPDYVRRGLISWRDRQLGLLQASGRVAADAGSDQVHGRAGASRSAESVRL